ncbi:septum site-determining protein Ssd [Nocardia vaccinii]|uniref:septum site-determining protein Ssd n=1 Tax=Nocardia vaccinii TaxID=1822 RepID=UPI0009FFAFB5|nr:septum site-determining protein Ssd [Nocardia vaccinii]
MNSVTAEQSPALTLVSGHRLREEVRRIAAAADRQLAEHSMPIGRYAWTEASLVILDTAAAHACAAAGYPRRPGTVLVSEGEPGAEQWEAAIAGGAELVLGLPAAADRLVEVFAEAASSAEGGGVVVAVVGAGGGAGASTLAGAIALTASAIRFRPGTILVDGDPFGGGLDLLLGIESEEGLRWPDLVVEDGRVAAATLRDALPAAAPGLRVLACGRVAPVADPTEIGPGAVRAVLDAGRAAGDLVVCDISRERGPHADQMLDGADLVVLVTTPRLRSIAAARAAVAHVRRRNPNQALIVRGPAPGGLHGDEVAEALGIPLLAAVRAQPGLSGQLERTGLTTPRGPLRVAAESVLSLLSGEDR